jgi:Protein of unknown function (DUF3137)
MSASLFGLVFSHQIQPKLQELDNERITINQNKKILLLATFFVTVVNLTLVVLVSSWFTILLFACFFGGMYKSFEKTAIFKSKFKDFIIPNIIKSIDPTLNYNKICTIPKAEILASNLYQNHTNRVTVSNEDIISTPNYGNMKIFESEIVDYYTTTEYVNNKPQNTEKEKSLFQGKILVADYPIKFYERTLVKRKSFLKFLKLEIPEGYERVTLESPEFMDLFEVFTTDQVEARMCLQTDIMTNLSDLIKLHDQNLEVSFANNRIFVTLSTGVNSFEIDMKKSITNPKIYQQFYDDVVSLLNIAKTLKLHQNQTTQKVNQSNQTLGFVPNLN